MTISSQRNNGTTAGTESNTRRSAATTQNTSRWRRRVRGSAHDVPGSQTAGIRYSLRNARLRNAKVKAMKYGRYGSIAVSWPIHAPLIPSESRTSGPTQQTEAPSAAKMLAIKVPLPVTAVIFISKPIRSMLL